VDRATHYDVAVVGASIAGCTAAVQYGRAGLRVALLERHRRATAFKQLCGHFVLAGTQPTLQRLGFWPAMTAAGAVTGGIALWNAAGWAVPDGPDLPRAISLRRSRLDPMLRRIAAGTPRVDLLLGHRAVDLVRDGRRVRGVVAEDADGTRTTVTARLVVGADGRHSRVAALARAAEDTAPNERFLYWAYYRGARPRGPGDNQVWFLEPDVAVAVPTDGGLTLLGVFPVKSRLAEFRADRAAALHRHLEALPDGPDLSGAARVSPVIGTVDYPPVRRDPTPQPGLALIGDAAMTGDPVPAVGCGWAFRSAEWLAEATVPVLVNGDDRGLERALRRYRRAHRFAVRHDRMDRADALARPANSVQRALRAAAPRDPVVAHRLYLYANRAIPVSGLLDPRLVLRAVRVSRRASAQARGTAAGAGRRQ
jgi:2-polyprenyl-6-methoxyphenol hydroxylase-like FAD-dependent oxidoreductase